MERVGGRIQFLQHRECLVRYKSIQYSLLEAEGGIRGEQDHVDELNMTNALINERKEELEERLNNKDRELSELKVPTFLYKFIFPGFPLKIDGAQLQRSIHQQKHY